MTGDVFGRYRLLERIGIGGMAEVFLAVVVGGDGRSLVVKRILPQLALEQSFISMFFDEARLGRKLVHENIVALVDFGEVDQSFFTVLEYVDGVDAGVLAQRVKARRATLPFEHTAFIISQAARGLHYAHGAKDPTTGQPLGVIHRDVSPSNILLSRTGDVKIADFGVARSNMQSSRTSTGAIKGKIAYMAAEQLDALQLDGRTDVYALGVILWELLTGTRMHRGRTDVQIMVAVLQQPPVAPSTKNPQVPPVLDALTLRCLARDASERPASALELAEALERYLVERGYTKAMFAAWAARERALFEPELPAPPTPHRTRVSAAKPMPTSVTPATEQKTAAMPPPKPMAHPATELITPPTEVLVPQLRRVGAPPSHPGLKLAQKGPDRKREIVLYVEDEPENRDVAALRLRRSYELLLAENDEQACALMRERGHELAAILMDIQLKGSALDGIELVRLARGTLPDAKKPPYARNVPVLATPILFVTAYGSRYAEPELLAAGAQKLVTKPVNFGELTLALVDLHLKRATRT